MRKVLFLLVLVVVFTGMSMGQAFVYKDSALIALWSDQDPEYFSISATDIDFALFLLNIFYGCSYDVGDFDQFDANLVGVATPSGNLKESINGPAVHAVWAQGDDVCSDDPLTWGYGELGWTTRGNQQGGGFRVTGSGYLPDDPDICPGEVLKFSVVFNSQAKGGDGNEKVNLDCPE